MFLLLILAANRLSIRHPGAYAALAAGSLVAFAVLPLIALATRGCGRNGTRGSGDERGNAGSDARVVVGAVLVLAVRLKLAELPEGVC